MALCKLLLSMKKLLLILSIFFCLQSEGQTPMHWLRKRASSCDADAQKFIDSSGITGTDATAICNLVKQLKDSSLWSSMTAIYPFVGGTSSTCKWNLKDPRNLDAAYRLTFSGTWSFTSSGADPNGTDAYANTYLNPTSVYSDNLLHFSYYSTENTGTGTKEDLGSIDGSNAEIAVIAKFSDGNSYPAIGSVSFPSAANSNSSGYYVTNRQNTTNIEMYKNGSNTVDGAQTQGRSNVNVYVGARNNNGTADRFSDHNCAFVSIGTALTAAQITTLNIIVEAFNDALGRGVQ